MGSSSMAQGVAFTAMPASPWKPGLPEGQTSAHVCQASRTVLFRTVMLPAGRRQPLLVTAMGLASSTR